MSKAAARALHDVIRVICAAALLGASPARGAAVQQADEGPCPEVRRCLDLLEDGIDFIESGRWEAASVVLEEVVAGLEERPPYARDLARAYVYLGVARLQVADAGETRQLFAEAQTRDPTLELGPAEFPRDVLEIWAEARELGGLLVESEPAGADVSFDGAVHGRTPLSVAGLKPGQYRVTLDHDGYVRASTALAVAAGRTERLFVSMIPAPDAVDVRGRDGVTRTDEPDGISTTARRPRAVAAEEAPADVLTTAQRFSADTTKKMGRSMWRTLIGVVGIVGGALMAGRECGVSGGERSGDGTPVEALGGTLMASGFIPSPQQGSSEGWVRWWGSCRLSYGWSLVEDGGGRIGGEIDDHEAMLRQLTTGAASFEDQLHRGLAESVGAARAELFFPRDRLAGGLVVAGLGALLATIWSDGGVVVEEVAVSVTPTGGVLASRSFGW